jgi:hypothetical protein
MIGQTLSHYQVLEKLGERGMAVEYKARDSALERLVVLKTLRPGQCADMVVSPDNRRIFFSSASIDSDIWLAELP